MRAFADTVARNAAVLFARRMWGFRVIELGASAFLIALVLGVYLFKGMAGAEGAQIADATRQIAAEQQQVHALRADLARLEAPERLQRLSSQYLGLAPVAARREAMPEALPIDAPTAPAAASPAPPAPAPSASSGQGARR